MRILILSLTLLLLSCTIFALTLEESIEFALRNNLSLQSAEQDVSIAREMYREVTSALLPQISFNGGYQLQRTELPGSMIPPLFNTSSELSETASEDDEMLAEYLDQGFRMFLPEKSQDETNFFGQVRLDQVVYLGGKLLSGIKAAGIYRTIEVNRYELTRQNLLYETTDLFYKGLLLTDVGEINKEALQLAEQHYSLISSMYAQGLVSEFDLIRVELELFKLRPQLQEAENNHSLWQESFRKHLGLEEEYEIDLEGEIIVPDELTIELEEALEAGRSDRIELYLTRAVRDMYEINWRAERGSYLPNIALSAEYNKFSNINEFTWEPGDFGTSYQVALGIQIPIFRGFGNRAKTAQARHQYKKATLDYLDLEDKIELDIRNSYLRLEHTRQNYNAQVVRVDLAERGLRIATTRYENQVGINLEVLDAQLEYKVARLAYLQAAYDVIMAQKSLQKSMGIEL